MRGTTARKVLITGARGLLGHYLAEHLDRTGHAVLRTVSTNMAPENGGLVLFDFATWPERQVAEFLHSNEITHVAHYAALSNVDDCEKRAEECRHYNVTLTSKLAAAANACGAQFIFASTNAVYDGLAAPYDETSVRNPVHVYGTSKRDAEDHVCQHSEDYLIFRFILAFGMAPPGARVNPLTQILEQYANGKYRLKMVDDVYANTLYAADAARAVARALDLGLHRETFNVAGGTRQNRYEFAMSVKEVFELSKLEIEPVSSAAFPSLIKRPPDTSFACAKLERMLGVRAKSVEDALADCRNEINKTADKQL